MPAQIHACACLCQVLQPGLVKGPWTKEEDQVIRDCIDRGITKWSEIAERIPGRIGKQVRHVFGHGKEREKRCCETKSVRARS
jgi:hypothetical protein